MITALIVAAGQGKRMGGAGRKQFREIGGRPILEWTLKAFDGCRQIDDIVLAVPEAEIEFCRHTIVAEAGLHHGVTLVAGGMSRQDSVYNGLKAIGNVEEAVVLIHDGVRPFVSGRLIAACISGARHWRACIPAVEVTDTIKQIDDSGIIRGTLPRDTLRSVQTPQAFELKLIKDAHQMALQKGWQATDDASLVERLGYDVHTIAGDTHNIKITTSDDLQRAEWILLRWGKNASQ